ncbi:MAG TPA: hypothetical protein V6D17_08765 [Candidatus Obscuribacterales bacterium]
MKEGQKLIRALMAVAIVAGSFSPVKAEPIYDWTIDVQTQQLQRQFEYKNSRLRPVDKVNVRYYFQKNVNSSVWYQMA